ncbi:MAG: MBL fold metallo-hydrolase [Anaerolineales bacterium]|nr:MBL fold metallo-hydrolase [Anaerolineales bacterium]
MEPRLIFLGTGAGCGVPSYFCDCAACEEAIAQPQFRRTRCAAAILGESVTLIDSPAELRTQLIQEGINRIDRFLMTHWHYDHAGGLGDLEFYVRVKRGETIPAYMSSETQEWLGSAFWFLQDCLDIYLIAPGYQVEADGVSYTALEVAHVPGTVGWLMETASGKRTAYITDTGPLPAATCEQVQGIDTLILGATFWGRNWMPDTHLSVSEAVQIALDLKVEQAYFTHLSMHHDTPVTNQELETYLKTHGNHLHLAYDGLQIEL